MENGSIFHLIYENDKFYLFSPADNLSKIYYPNVFWIKPLSVDEIINFN